MGIGNSFTETALKSSSKGSADEKLWQISISSPSLGEDSKSPSASLSSDSLAVDAVSNNLLTPPLLCKPVMVGVGKLLLGIDMALDLLSGGNSCSESDVSVDEAGVSSTVAGVDVDQREGSDSDEGGDMTYIDTTFDDGDGNDWNFLNLALCLCLKVSKKWSPGEGL